jgi:hypothetical protein
MQKQGKSVKEIIDTKLIIIIKRIAKKKKKKGSGVTEEKNRYDELPEVLHTLPHADR